MKITRQERKDEGFKPYSITIAVDSLHDEGILRTITARMCIIPQYLKDSGAYYFPGVTQLELHDLLAAIDKAALGGRY
jgi:hypothetical protein